MKFKLAKLSFVAVQSAVAIRSKMMYKNNKIILTSPKYEEIKLALISHESYNFQQSLRHLQDGLRPLRVRRRPLLRTLLNVKTTRFNLNNNVIFHFPISQAVVTLHSTNSLLTTQSGILIPDTGLPNSRFFSALDLMSE